MLKSRDQILSDNFIEECFATLVILDERESLALFHTHPHSDVQDFTYNDKVLYNRILSILQSVGKISNDVYLHQLKTF